MIYHNILPTFFRDIQKDLLPAGTMCNLPNELGVKILSILRMLGSAEFIWNATMSVDLDGNPYITSDLAPAARDFLTVKLV